MVDLFFNWAGTVYAAVFAYVIFLSIDKEVFVPTERADCRAGKRDRANKSGQYNISEGVPRFKRAER